ncbi:MAG TPA: hypothetical protein VHT26_15315 [Trebonia sp.]|nr:hypothetical protein [Trebonia sp.]
MLLDIAERGRSRGIILIGAQQTASEVERRTVSNSAIRVVGRLDSAEAGRPEYGFPPSSEPVPRSPNPVRYLSPSQRSPAACRGVPVPGLGKPAVGVPGITADYYAIDSQLQGSGSITCKIVVTGPGDNPLTVSHGAASGGYNICDAQAAPTDSTGLSWTNEA